MTITPASFKAGLKRLRTLLFPKDFVKQQLWSLARRSQYIMAQLEFLGGDDAERGLDLPAELGSLGLECLMVSRADLLSAPRAKLKEYLKVSFNTCS